MQASTDKHAGAGRWATVGCIAAAAFALILAAPAHVPRAGAQTDPDPATEADRLLQEASDALDAAAAWLKGSVEEFSKPGAARRWLEQRVDQAGIVAPAGVRLASAPTPEAEGDASEGEPAAPQLTWTPVADVEGDLPPRLVLLVHGLDEPGSIWNDLAPALVAEGLDVARFDYPNDQPIADSADAMAEALRGLAQRGVKRIDIVGHSMGGLVARDVLSREAYYGGVADAHDGFPDVGRLITLGTPHTGSPWASLQAIGEIREQLARWIASDGKDAGALLGFAGDGAGEAAEDLKPGSPFLTDLNAREAPAGVEITCIRATITPDEARAMLAVLEWPLARTLLSEEQIHNLEAGSEDLIRKLGDGVVPHESAVMEGVEDVVDVEANHRSMVLRWQFLDDARRAMGKDDRVAPAIPVVIARLKMEGKTKAARDE